MYFSAERILKFSSCGETDLRKKPKMYDVSEEEEIQRYCRHNNYVLQQAPRASLCTARDGCLKLALVNTIKYIRHTEQSPIIASLRLQAKNHL